MRHEYRPRASLADLPQRPSPDHREPRSTSRPPSPLRSAPAQTQTAYSAPENPSPAAQPSHRTSRRRSSDSQAFPSHTKAHHQSKPPPSPTSPCSNAQAHRALSLPNPKARSSLPPSRPYSKQPPWEIKQGQASTFF